MQVTLNYSAPMAFDAQTGSGHTIKIDASPDIGGQDSGARPMELLLAGLGGCSAIDVLSILRKGRQQVSDCQVTVKAERAETVPKVFTHISVHFIVTGIDLQPSKVERAVRLSSEKYCSASIMLEKTAQITPSWEIIDSAAS
jgi:putative redox protein